MNIIDCIADKFPSELSDMVILDAIASILLNFSINKMYYRFAML